MSSTDSEQTKALATIKALATEHQIPLPDAQLRRTSSRFCLGVEHGDYNGTELFGFATDRFIWHAFSPRADNKVRVVSSNFKDEGVVELTLGQPRTNPAGDSAAKVAHCPPELADSWARFVHGVDFTLRKAGLPCDVGFDGVLHGNIPGGGMSRSASLAINLILTFLQLAGHKVGDGEAVEHMRVVELAQAVENDYVGSPCGNLDQIMIYFSKAGMGTHYKPSTQTIEYVPLGDAAGDWSVGALDSGTTRHGLEKSTYSIRKAECDELVALMQQQGFQVSTLADVKGQAMLERVRALLGGKYPGHMDRLSYIFNANERFGAMLDAWKRGDIEAVGECFRKDGNELRDLYSISGPELQTMCDIVRTVPGVLGERMLGGGDKGASGCLLRGGAEAAVQQAVQLAYPRAYPELQDKFATHFVQICDGVTLFDSLEDAAQERACPGRGLSGRALGSPVGVLGLAAVLAASVALLWSRK